MLVVEHQNIDKKTDIGVSLKCTNVFYIDTYVHTYVHTYTYLLDWGHSVLTDEEVKYTKHYYQWPEVWWLQVVCEVLVLHNLFQLILVPVKRLWTKSIVHPTDTMPHLNCKDTTTAWWWTCALYVTVTCRNCHCIFWLYYSIRSTISLTSKRMGLTHALWMCEQGCRNRSVRSGSRRTNVWPTNHRKNTILPPRLH